MNSTVINNSVKLIIVASVFVFSGCGGGGKTPVTGEPSTNTGTPNLALTASDYSVILDINKSTSNSDWFVKSKALDAQNDALSATVLTQGKYGTFVVTGHGLSYLRTTESKEIDTGILSISDGTHSITIAVSVNALYWKKIKGSYHTVAIKSDGTLWTWGNNKYGQLGDGTTENKLVPTQENTKANDWKSVSVGIYYTVAVKNDGTLWTWGHNKNGQLGDGTKEDKLVPTQESTKANNWQSISTGFYHTIALKSDSSLWAWGDNTSGKLGDGTNEDKLVPTQESTLSTNWQSVVGGYGHTVALKSDGSLWAWGDNRYGQLGDGTTESKVVPTQESTHTTDWQSATLGALHSMAIKSDGTLWAWGSNEYGQLGDDSTSDTATPTQESTASRNWTSLGVAAYYHSVAIKSDGTLWAWGRNVSGQLGDGTTIKKSVPTQESTHATDWESATGSHHVLALKKDGILWAWGSNYSGQLGDGRTTNKLIPIKESTNATDWQSASVGLEHTVAIKNDGTLWAWGSNEYGQLGDGTTVKKILPTQESTKADDWVNVEVGKKYTIALKSDGTLWAWGNNQRGQLGNNTTSSTLVPTQESTGTTNWQSVVAGDVHTIALKNDGTLWAWGYNEYGQLGDGMTEDKLIPTQESTLATNWKSATVGGVHSIAIKEDGTLWSWGYNLYGRLGDGSTTQKSIPTQESSKSTNWQSATGGNHHTIAIKNDGTLWAWGSNHFGKLGDGTIENKSVPTQESTKANDWQSASAGFHYTLAIKSDGTLWSWGENKYGQLGDGTKENKLVPTQESTLATNWQSATGGSTHAAAIKSDGSLWAWGRNNRGQLTGWTIIPTLSQPRE